MQTASWIVIQGYSVAVTTPLRALYFHGPQIAGYGFWGGMPPADVCAHLTQVSASVWFARPEDCADLLDRKFNSFLVAVGCAAYIYSLWKLLTSLLFRYLYVRPIAQEIAQSVKTVLTESQFYRLSENTD